MSSPRAKMMTLSLFALTLAAGAVAGLLISRLPAKELRQTSGSPLVSELELSNDQKEKMQKIWEKVRDLSEDDLKQSTRAQGERDRAIEKLIPPDKTADYNKILHDYAETNASLKGKQEAEFKKAVVETKAILTPDQQKKYQKILDQRLGTGQYGAHDAPSENGVNPA